MTIPKEVKLTKENARVALEKADLGYPAFPNKRDKIIADAASEKAYKAVASSRRYSLIIHRGDAMKLLERMFWILLLIAASMYLGYMIGVDKIVVIALP